MEKKIRKFTVIEWMDPTDRDEGWVSEEDVKRLNKPCIVSTFGEIIEEDEKFIKLAYNCEDASRSAHGTGVITKSTIVRRRDYKYPWRGTYKIKREKQNAVPSV